MDAHDPNPATAAVGTPLALGTIIASNALAWGQSITAGALASGLTLIGGAFLGLVGLWYSKVVPAQIAAEQARDVARKESYAGKVDALILALAQAKDRTDAEIALAHTAAERSDQLAAMVDELRAEVAKGNTRLEDANHKLHGMTRQIQAAESRAHLAELELHDVLDQVRKNAGLTEEAKASILGVLDEAHRAADHVAEKADRVADQVAASVARVADMIQPPTSQEPRP